MEETSISTTVLTITYILRTTLFLGNTKSYYVLLIQRSMTAVCFEKKVQLLRRRNDLVSCLFTYTCALMLLKKLLRAHTLLLVLLNTSLRKKSNPKDKKNYILVSGTAQQFLQILYGLDSSAVWDKIVIVLFVNTSSCKHFTCFLENNQTRYHFLHIHVRYTMSKKNILPSNDFITSKAKKKNDSPFVPNLYLSMLLLNTLFKIY